MGFVEDVVDGPKRLGSTSCPFLPPNVSRGTVPRRFRTCASGLWHRDRLVGAHQHASIGSNASLCADSVVSSAPVHKNHRFRAVLCSWSAETTESAHKLAFDPARAGGCAPTVGIRLR